MTQEANTPDRQGERDYRWQLHLLEQDLLRMLRVFETEFEDIQFGELGASQARLRAAQEELIPHTRLALETLTPPPALAGLHHDVHQALADLENAYEYYLNGRGNDFINALFHCRQLFIRAVAALYSLRADLPVVSRYFLIPALHDQIPYREQPDGAGVQVPVGVVRVPANDDHEAFSLYVPEDYDPAGAPRPLIVCLHGASGSGEEYLWTWLRLAKSHGYLLLAPKSTEITWSVLRPEVDIASVAGAIDRVRAEYHVDRNRTFLTGLSDGATFSYLLAFLAPEYFAGVAPVAGELSQIAEPLLRKKEGRDVPVFVVHGRRDHIFPIETVRSTSGLLNRLGYAIRFDELPDWGHAYPYRINEELVFPWFDALPGKNSSA